MRTNDGRMIFFFPERNRVNGALPASCDELGGVHAVALLTYAATPQEKARIGALPCLTPVAGVPSSWWVYGVR